MCVNIKENLQLIATSQPFLKSYSLLTFLQISSDISSLFFSKTHFECDTIFRLLEFHKDHNTFVPSSLLLFNPHFIRNLSIFQFFLQYSPFFFFTPTNLFQITYTDKMWLWIRIVQFLTSSYIQSFHHICKNPGSLLKILLKINVMWTDQYQKIICKMNLLSNFHYPRLSFHLFVVMFNSSNTSGLWSNLLNRINSN